MAISTDFATLFANPVTAGNSAVIKAAQIAGQQALEEQLKNCTKWKVVASAKNGQFDEISHPEMLSNLLLVSISGRYTGTPFTTISLSDDEDSDEESYVNWTKGELVGATLNLDLGEGARELYGALDARPANSLSNAKAVEFYVYTAAVGSVGMTGTVLAKVQHVDFGSLANPAGVTMTEAEQKALVTQKKEISKGIRAESLAKTLALRNSRMAGSSAADTTIVSTEPVGTLEDELTSAL